MIHGQDGVALTTPQSLTQTAGTNLDQIAQRDHNQTTGRRWIHNVGQHISLFVSGVKDKVTLKLIATKGKVQLQAQSDDIEITADKNVKLTAIKGQNLFNAKQEILLTAGGAYIRIKGGKIELHAPGKVSFKGASHDWSGPKSMNLASPILPPSQPCSGIFEVWRAPERQLKNRKYRLVAENGTEITGVLGKDGKTGILGTSEMAQMTLYIAELPENQQISGAFKQKLTSAQSEVQALAVEPEAKISAAYRTALFDGDLYIDSAPIYSED